MYRFHIKPIPQDNANTHVQTLYQDILEILNLKAVPLVFQYVANYERYFDYIWERMRANLLSDDYIDSCRQIRTFSEQAVGYLETPSTELAQFVQKLQKTETSHIHSTVGRLDATNLKMMLIMIGLRESIKGIYQARKVLPGVSEGDTETVEQVFRIKLEKGEEPTELTKAARMLAPLFGNNAVMISQYPEFFGLVAAEMERLENTQGYLLTRVGLEQIAFAYIEQFTVPLNCSFVEFMRLTDGTGYVDEILYLLKDTFPSRFPHLVLTTAVMKKALKTNDSSTAIVKKV